MNQKERANMRKKEYLEAKKLKTMKLINTGKNPNCCEMCKSDIMVSDHHIIKKAEDNYKFNSDVNNLIRVCNLCHSKFHAYDSKFLMSKNKELFKSCLEWLKSNKKHVTLSKFEQNI